MLSGDSADGADTARNEEGCMPAGPDDRSLAEHRGAAVLRRRAAVLNAVRHG